MIKCNDGGYILGGKTSSHDGLVFGIHDTVWGLEDYWVIKVDSIGNLIWQKCLGGIGYDNLYNLVNDMDNGYIISGLIQSMMEMFSAIMEMQIYG
jgi:hypothetical protein